PYTQRTRSPLSMCLSFVLFRPRLGRYARIDSESRARPACSWPGCVPPGPGPPGGSTTSAETPASADHAALASSQGTRPLTSESNRPGPRPVAAANWPAPTTQGREDDGPNHDCGVLGEALDEELASPERTRRLRTLPGRRRRRGRRWRPARPA